MCKIESGQEKIVHKHKQIQNRSNPYIFCLKRLNPNDTGFEPIYADLALSFQSPKKYYPYYLKDAKLHSPSFIFPALGPYEPEKCNKNLYPQNSDEEEQLQGKEVLITIPEPQPGLFSRFCGVCRREYHEYFEHIESKEHQQSVDSSVYHKQIKIVSEKYVWTEPSNGSEAQDFKIVHLTQMELLQTRPQTGK